MFTRYRIYDEDVISEASHCSQMSTQHHNGSVAGSDHPMSPPARPYPTHPQSHHTHHGHAVHNHPMGNGSVNTADLPPLASANGPMPSALHHTHSQG